MSIEGILMLILFPTIIVVGIVTELLRWENSYKKNLKAEADDETLMS